MLAVVVVLAVLSALLAALLWRATARSRRLADASTEQAEQHRQALAAADARADEATAARAAADEHATEADERAASATERAEAAEALVEQAAHDAEAAHDRALDVESERLQLLTTLADTEAQLATLTAEITPLRARLAELEVEDRHHLDQARPGIEAESLWQLELARSERTWRHSVAASPDGPGPFADVTRPDDALRTAVEIEVAALREDVGAAMELHWDAQVDDPARCLTVLRLTQELLAAAAREQQAVVLHGGRDADGDVVLRLSVPEDHDPIQIAVPPLGANLRSTRTAAGLEVTVH